MSDKEEIIGIIVFFVLGCLAWALGLPGSRSELAAISVWFAALVWLVFFLARLAFHRRLP